MQIAQSSGADKYAADSFQRAQTTLRQSEDRETAQTAEDSRVIALKRQEEEALEKERQASAAREAGAKRQAEQEQQRCEKAEAERKTQEARRAQAEAAKAAAETRRLQAELAAAKEAAERAKAEAAQAQSSAAAEKAARAAAQANRLRQQAELEKQQLRAQLLQQLNAVLERKIRIVDSSLRWPTSCSTAASSRCGPPHERNYASFQESCWGILAYG